MTTSPNEPIPKYQYTDDMGEISGFGGDYEEACRKMVIAGVTWLDGNKEKDPRWSTFENIFGMIVNENEDAKELVKIMSNAAGESPTGAMVQATLSHVLYIVKNGWEQYCNRMRNRDDDDSTETDTNSETG